MPTDIINSQIFCNFLYCLCLIFYHHFRAYNLSGHKKRQTIDEAEFSTEIFVYVFPPTEHAGLAILERISRPVCI